MTRPTTTGKAQDLITFTRSTTGTALAKISYGEELVTNGDFSSGVSGWTAFRSATLSNVSNKLKIDNNQSIAGSSASQQITTTVGKAYLFSCTVVSTTNNNARLALGSASGDLGSGLSSDLGQLSALSAGNYTIIFTATTTGTWVVVSPQSLGATAVFDNISVKEVLYDQPDGTLQLINHPINKPRIEYDASGNCLGLLMEEEKTNLLPQSIANADWQKIDVSITENFATAPDESSTAYKISETTTNAIHYAQQINIQFTSGITYTESLIAKAGTNSVVQLLGTSGIFGSLAWANFDLSDGTIGSKGAEANAAIKPLGNGWYRCSLTMTATVSNSATAGFIILVPNKTYPRAPTYQGNSDNHIYAWGIQTEAGSFPSSYIPTSGSAATRADDLASLAVSKFGYNQNQGSVVVESDFFGGTDTSALCYIGEDTSDRIVLYYSNQNLSFQVKSSGATQASENLSGQRNKAAYRYKLNDMNLAGNGDTTVADTSANLLGGTQDNIYIGSYYHNAGAHLNGHIKSIKYYPVGLSNAQLQALTV